MDGVLGHDDTGPSPASRRADSWITAACPVVVADSTVGRTPGWSHLPRRQQCDVAALALASLATVGWLIVPFVSEQPRPVLESIAVHASLVTVPRAPSLAPGRDVANAATRTPRRRAFAPAPRGMEAEGEAPALVVRSRRAGPELTLAFAESAQEPGPERPARHGVLARFLLGDGRHRVQPFPAPSN